MHICSYTFANSYLYPVWFKFNCSLWLALGNKRIAARPQSRCMLQNYTSFDATNWIRRVGPSHRPIKQSAKLRTATKCEQIIKANTEFNNFLRVIIGHRMQPSESKKYKSACLTELNFALRGNFGARRHPLGYAGVKCLSVVHRHRRTGERCDMRDGLSRLGQLTKNNVLNQVSRLCSGGGCGIMTHILQSMQSARLFRRVCNHYARLMRAPLCSLYHTLGEALIDDRRLTLRLEIALAWNAPGRGGSRRLRMRFRCLLWHF
jgi:hypothetical protein